MRYLVLLLGVVLAGCGQPGADSGATPSTGSGTIVSERGVSVTVPDGWHAETMRGRLRLANYPGDGDPAAGEAVAFLDEFSTASAGGGPYPDLVGPLGTHPGEYPSPEFATEADPGPQMTGAARFFSDAGRRFELMALYGGDTPADATVSALNNVLATLRVQAGDYYDQTLDPPSFAPADGWYVGHDPPAHERPEGDQLCAWASTVPYQDPQSCPIPASTIDALPADGMVISVAAYRSWQPLSGSPLSDPLMLPAQLGPPQEGGRRSFDISGPVGGSYQLDVHVYVADGAVPTAAMRARAQAILDGLVLPTWPS